MKASLSRIVTQCMSSGSGLQARFANAVTRFDISSLSPPKLINAVPSLGKAWIRGWSGAGRAMKSTAWTCAAALVGLICLLPSAASAQTTLLSNTGQFNFAGRAPHEGLLYANGFQTGDHEQGYTLHSVVLDASVTARNLGAAPLIVTIRERDGDTDNPQDTVFATLSNPANIGTGMNEFTAPADTILSHSTRYYIVVQHDVPDDRQAFSWVLNQSNDVDGGTASGWSQVNRHRARNGGVWGDTISDSRTFRFRVVGSAVGLTNNAATGSPEITGTLRAGESLTAVLDSIDDSDGVPQDADGYGYQWQREASEGNWFNLISETMRQYTVSAEDASSRIRVVVSFTDDNGVFEEVASTPTGTVPTAPEVEVEAETEYAVGATEDAMFVISRNESPAYPLVVVFTLTGDESAYVDYDGRPSMITIPANDADATVMVETAAQGNRETNNIILTIDSDRAYKITESTRDRATVTVRPVNRPATIDSIILEGAGAEGDATVGEELRIVTRGVPRDDNGYPGTRVFGWQREQMPNIWQPIQYETGIIYTLTDADVGRRVRGLTWFTDLVGYEEELPSPPTSVVRQVNSPATGITVLLSGDGAEGDATVGEAIMASTSGTLMDGNGEPDPFEFEWKWQRETSQGALAANTAAIEAGTDPPHANPWVDIMGQMTNSYTLHEDDLGLQIRAVASFTDNDDYVEEFESDPTLAVRQVNHPATGVMVELAGVGTMGTADLGEAVTASASGTIADDNGIPTVVTVQTLNWKWQRETAAGNWVSGEDDMPGDWMDIESETMNSYTLARPDVGLRVRAVAWFTDEHDFVEEFESTPTEVVRLVNLPASGITVSLSGDGTMDDATVGEDVMASTSGTAVDGNGVPNPLAYQWKWQREVTLDAGDWMDIGSATSELYTLATADVGHRVRAVAYFTDDDDYVEEFESVATAAVRPVNHAATGVTVTLSGAGTEGDATEGESLTAETMGTPNDDNGVPDPLVYQWKWQREVTLDAGDWMDIGSATSDSYTLATADIGHRVRAVAYFTDDDDYVEEFESVATAAVRPVNHAATGVTVELAGVGTMDTADIGEAVTASALGTIADDNGVPMGVIAQTLSWKWQRETAAGNWVSGEDDMPGDWMDIESETTNSYTLARPDVGLRVRAVAWFTDEHDFVEEFESTPTEVVRLVNLPASGITVSLSGDGTMDDATVGEDVMASTSGTAVDGNGVPILVVYRWNWQRENAAGTWVSGEPDMPGDWTDIGSATAATYKLAAADTGLRVRAVARFLDEDNFENFFYSTPTTAVMQLPDEMATGDPEIEGVLNAGVTLTVDVVPIMDDNGLTLPDRYAYQWRRADDAAGTGAAAISGARESTYTVADGDAGKFLQVVVTVTDDQGYEADRPSDWEGPVNTPAVGEVTVTGDVLTDRTLTAVTASIMDADGTVMSSFSYQWQRSSDDTFASTTPIGGDSDTYTVVSQDVNNFIRVEVTFTDDASFMETKRSGPANNPNTGGEVTYVGVPRHEDSAGTDDLPLSDVGNWRGRVGQMLTATVDLTELVDPNGVPFGLAFGDLDWQWKRQDTNFINDPVNIAGANTPAYTLVAADGTNYVWAEASFTDEAGYREVVYSEFIDVEKAASTPATGVMVLLAGDGVTGGSTVGETITASTSGTPMDLNGVPPTVTYEWKWQRETSPGARAAAEAAIAAAIAAGDDPPETDPWDDIPGETAAMYTLTPHDIGLQVRAEATFYDNEDYGNHFYSTPTPAVVRRDDIPPTGKPEISGTSTVGESLMAVTDPAMTMLDIMDGNGLTNPVYTYVWQREATLDAGDWVDIPNATGSTYVLAEADEGKRVRVAVMFDDDENWPNTLTSDPTAAVHPANISATGVTVALSGDGTVGDATEGEDILAASTGAASDGNGPASPTLMWKWQRETNLNAGDWVDIASQTSILYTLAAADVGHRIRAVAWFTDDDGYLEEFPSAATMTVLPADFPAMGDVTITGVLEVGETLTAVTIGITDGNGLNTPGWTYAWQRADDDQGTNAAPISGATAATYTLVDLDNDEYIGVEVTFTDNDGYTYTRDAYRGSVVLPDTPATGMVTITGGSGTRDGAATAGDSLMAELSMFADAVNGLTNPTYTYQWERADDLAGMSTESIGTGASFTVREEDDGHYIRVVVMFADDDGHEEEIESGYIRTNFPFLNIVVTLEGPGSVNEAFASEMISAAAGSVGAFITDRNGIVPSFIWAYKWQREATLNAGDWEDIAGANTRMYRLAPADINLRVRAVASTVDADGFNNFIYSEPTADVEQPANIPATGVTVVLSGVGVEGESTVGEAITASSQGDVVDGNGRSSPGRYWKWQRETALNADDWVDIENATTDTYTLAAADAGRRVRAVSGFIDDAGWPEEFASEPTMEVMQPPNIPAMGVTVSLMGDGVDGSSLVGEAVDASASGTLADDNGIPVGVRVQTLNWKWQRETTLDAGDWVDIGSATSNTYTLAVADAGVRVRAVAWFTDVAGHVEEFASSATAAVVQPDNIPATGVIVALTGDGATGDATVGETVEASASGTPVDDNGIPAGVTLQTFNWKWQRETTTDVWEDIGSATTNTYTLAAADVGLRVRVVAWFTDVAGHVEEFESDATMAVRPVNQPADGEVDIVGSPGDVALTENSDGDLEATVGDALRALVSAAPTDGNGLPSPLVYAWQWKRQPTDPGTAVDIDGATDQTYTLVPEDGDNFVWVEVSFEDSVGYTETISSTSMVAVEQAASSPATGVEVLLTGPGSVDDATVGEIVMAETSGTPVDSNGVPDSFEYEWQWKRGDAAGSGVFEDIPGADSETYTLAAADVGRQVLAEASFTDRAGYVNVFVSEPTAAVQPENIPATGLTVTLSGDGADGDAIVGETVEASTAGTPEDGNGVPDPVVFEWKWQRETSQAVWEDIEGETSASYTLAAADVGLRVRAVTLFTDSDGYVEEFESAATAAVAATAALDVATVSVEAVTDEGGYVQSGEDVVFVLSRTETTGTLQVAVAWSGADGLANTSPSTAVDFEMGSAEARVELESAALSPGDARITVTLTVEPDAAYTVGTQGSAMAVVRATNSVITGDVRFSQSVPRVDESFSVSTSESTFTDLNGITGGFGSASYQWSLASDADGDNAEEIAGETSLAYTPVSTDEGSHLQVTVSFVDDDGYEESLSSEWTAAVLAAPAAVDPPTPELSIRAASATVVEPDPDSSPIPFEFEVAINPAPTKQITVEYSIGGTASLGSDYTAHASYSDGVGTITLDAEATGSETVSILILGDLVSEPDGETVVVTLIESDGVEIGDSDSATVTITERADQIAVSATIEPDFEYSDESEETTVSFEISLSTRAPAAGDVDWRAVLTDPDDTSGSAGRSASARVAQMETGMVSFAAGDRAKSASVDFDGRLPAGGRIEIQLKPFSGAGVSAVAPSVDLEAGDPETFSEAGSSEVWVIAGLVRIRSGDSIDDWAATSALTAFGRSAATSLVDTIWSRAEAHRSGGASSFATLNGRSVDTSAFAAGAGTSRAAHETARLFGIDVVDPALAPVAGVAGGSVTEGNLDDFRSRAGISDDDGIVERSSFSLALGEGEGSSIVYWGSGSLNSYASELEDDRFSDVTMSSDGSTTTISLGLDFRLNETTLMGFAVSSVSGSSEYEFVDSHEEGGELSSSLTSLTPWLRWKSAGGTEIWGAVGIGSGAADGMQDGETVEMDLGAQIIAVGAWSQVASLGNSKIAAKADYFSATVTSDGAGEEVDGTDAASSRIRIAAEMSSRGISSTQSSAYALELGARQDSGEAESGAGVDVAGEFDFGGPRSSFRVTGRGGIVLSHGQEGFSETSFGLGITYDPSADARGLQLSLQPTWNAPRSNTADSMWNAVSSSSLKTVTDQGATMQARLGYSVGAIQDWALATLYGEAESGANYNRRLRLGGELRGHDGVLKRLSLGLYGEREERPGSMPDHSVMLEGEIGF